MTDSRTVEDRLREEYAGLLPGIRRVVEYLETEVRHCVLSVYLDLRKYEQIVVKSRIKTCESAVDALRRRQQFGIFDLERPNIYRLADLNDLAGVRVLAFPRKRVEEINEKLCEQFPRWTSDPVKSEGENDLIAHKYYGSCEASTSIRGEIQIVSMLTGLFWEVEHSAFYKLDPELKGVDRGGRMQERVQGIYRALASFEEGFEDLVSQREDIKK